MKYKALIIFTTFLSLLFQLELFAGEYTNSFKLKIEGKGESLEGDPVEAFNHALDNAMNEAAGQGEVYIQAESSTRDNVLEESWIKKEAHLQITDLQVTKYAFSKPPGEGPKYVRADMNVHMKLEYIDVPKFMEDYQKTVQGAAYRSMAIPGWGQLYNRQYTTSLLYGAAFWSFYTLFIINSQRATTSADLNNAMVNFQVPAVIFWSFNVSEAITSRIMGRQGLENLRQAYRIPPEYRYEPITERGFKIDLILFQIPLYKLWRND